MTVGIRRVLCELVVTGASILLIAGCERAEPPRQVVMPTRPPTRATVSHYYSPSLPTATTLTIAGIPFVQLPIGSGLIGSAEGTPGRSEGETQKLVAIGAPCWMSATEITQTQYSRVMGGNPSQTTGEDYPVTCVTYTEAVAFCQRLTASVTSHHFRLPSEDEWEYACRAGEEGPFPAIPDDLGAVAKGLKLLSGGDKDYLGRQVARMAWFNAPAPRPVAQGSPSAWGLYDMLGNVWEWCDVGTAPEGSTCPLRGGAWCTTDVLGCRPASRSVEESEARKDSIGFRVMAEPVDS